jgi:hypothetical protein
MGKWPLWLKAVIAVAGLAGLIALSQLVLYLDRMGASKFDL